MKQKFRLLIFCQCSGGLISDYHFKKMTFKKKKKLSISWAHLIQKQPVNICTCLDKSWKQNKPVEFLKMIKQ